MIPQDAFIASYIMIAIGIGLPVGLAIFWIVTKKGDLGTVIAGAATWFVFAVVLEGIAKSYLFSSANPVGRAILGSTALTAAVGALLAGIFEETGRLIVFRIILKKRNNKEVAVSHGIGHGGFEALYLLVIAGVQNLIYAAMINAGGFQQIIDTAAASGIDVSALEKIPEALLSLTPLTVCISGFERICAILLHIGLSILVFYAVKQKKIGLYFLAVLLHACFDVPAALYQLGIIKSVYAVEAILGVYAAVFFVTIFKKLYGADEPDYEVIQH